MQVLALEFRAAAGGRAARGLTGQTSDAYGGRRHPPPAPGHAKPVVTSTADGRSVRVQSVCAFTLRWTRRRRRRGQLHRQKSPRCVDVTR